MPKPAEGESRDDFISRCMSEYADDYTDESQRMAVCNSLWRTEKHLKIEKVDEDQRMVFGWASVIKVKGEDVVDLDGDIIEESELEKAAYDFVLESRKAGDMHRKMAGRLVESIVFTEEKQKSLGIDLGKVGWFVGFKIDDDEVWKMVKDGKRTMFSIGVRAKRNAA